MRIDNRGVIDRSVRVSFEFDGETYEGFEGDTVASALLANGVRLMGRSFKYHRPRGVFTAGSEEPNALIEKIEGNQTTPNVRATMQEIYNGLEVRSQNRFPSLKFDVMAVNDMLSPFLSAGFYYKTFMWPKAFWEKIYEPVIRRAAGLGALSGKADTDVHDRAFAHCDVLVIGSGPAGLMAALTAAKAGASVILADEDAMMGGRLNSETYKIDGLSGVDWAADVLGTLRLMPNVRLMSRTTVTGAYDGGTFGALERVSEHVLEKKGAPLTTFWRIAAKRSILCGGAIERGIAFDNNDRPGIMMAGAVRSYVNKYGVAPAERVAIFTNNDDGHRTALDLQETGVEVVAVIDTRPDATALCDVPLITGAEVIETRGRLALREITVARSSGEQVLEVDCLAVSGGWNPAVHLTCHLNGRPVWRDDIAAFAPVENAVPLMSVAGAANGEFTTQGALDEGYAQAKSALKELGIKQPRITPPTAVDTPVSITPFWHVSEIKGRAWLDLQNDVTVKDIKLAHRENFRSVEHMKRYTTLGMATDQGKTSNIGALAIMAELSGLEVPEVGTTTFRPPYSAVPLASLGARSTGRDFAPERFIPSNAWSHENNVTMVEAGLWHRPAWFTHEGETNWRQSCDREVNMVRSTVGICDVTSLGKIDVQGPDAAAFLDRVYSNMMSTLKVGKVRYGLMLREDGIVMDDGTAARIADDHYVITTTTSGAGEVMSHLEFCAQCLWPELDVAMISVTEQWAQFAIAGPLARDVLIAVCDAAVSDEDVPYMGHAAISIGGVEGRLFRISFSGEHGYELAVPTRYGDSLMRMLMAEAEKLDGGAYGLEALNVLRIEKGFITHAEIDGRVTADDIGMGRMVSAKKDAVGKIMSMREGLHGAERQQLVGLKPVGAVKRILAGSHVVNVGDEPVRVNDQGYVSSACYSPTLETCLGYGMVKNGRARMGEKVRVIHQMRGIETLCEIVNPVFFDVEGGRLRG